MAFEEVLPWRRFSVRLNFSDIPYLPRILDRIPPGDAKCAESLRCFARGHSCAESGLASKRTCSGHTTLACNRVLVGVASSLFLAVPLSLALFLFLVQRGVCVWVGGDVCASASATALLVRATLSFARRT
eukprot:1114255-Pleurochrysis_carterae.AAC.2